MFPFVLRSLADILHCDIVIVFGKDTLDDIGIAFGSRTGFPGECMIVVDDNVVIQLRTIIVGYLFDKILKLSGCLDIKGFENAHDISIFLSDNGCGNGGV